MLKPILSLLPLLAAVAHAAPLAVDRFSPQGSTRNVRQVQAHFAQPAVAIGNPKLPPPFQIQCSEPGNGRWVDAQNWVYDFERELPGGVSCRFSTDPAFRAASGDALQPAKFQFNTGGPMLAESRPDGSTVADGEESGGAIAVDEEQVFLLRFDAPLKAGSLAANAWCEVDGLREKIPALVLAGGERDQLLKQLFRDPAKQEFELLRCQRKLPAGRKLQIKLGKGLQAATGAASGEVQTLRYQVRPDFTLSASCERANAKAGCLPILPLTLRFSAPAVAASAGKIVLKYSEGRIYAPVANEEARSGWLQALTFRGPFPEKSTLMPILPPDLRDDARRPLANFKAASQPIKVDAYPPLAKFAASFGIVEANAGGLLPVTVRNLTSFQAAETKPAGGALAGTLAPTAAAAAQPPQGALYRLLPLTDEQQVIRWLSKGLYPHPVDQNDTRQPEEISVLKNVPGVLQGNLPTPTSNREAEVIGIPLPKLGFQVVEIESPRLGAHLLDSKNPMYVRASALNTNMAVQLKLGDETSLV